MPPFLGGGSMIETVDDDRLDVRARRRPGSRRHPADRGGGRAGRGRGLPDRAGHGRDPGAREALTAYALERWRRCRTCGSSDRPTPATGAATISFELEGIHPHDVGQVLDSVGVAGPRRAPLRAADLPPVRGGGDDPGLVLPVQHDAEVDALVARSGAGAEGVRLMQLDQLYQEIILDHYKHPRGRGLREPYAAEVPSRQPDLRGRDHAAGAGGWQGRRRRVVRGEGCSISQASASVLHELVHGQAPGGGAGHAAGVRGADGRSRPGGAGRGGAGGRVAFAGVASIPARVKCALLAWMAFKDAAARAGATVATGASE